MNAITTPRLRAQEDESVLLELLKYGPPSISYSWVRGTATAKVSAETGWGMGKL